MVSLAAASCGQGSLFSGCLKEAPTSVVLPEFRFAEPRYVNAVRHLPRPETFSSRLAEQQEGLEEIVVRLKDFHEMIDRVEGALLTKVSRKAALESAALDAYEYNDKVNGLLSNLAELCDRLLQEKKSDSPLVETINLGAQHAKDLCLSYLEELRRVKPYELPPSLRRKITYTDEQVKAFKGRYVTTGKSFIYDIVLEDEHIQEAYFKPDQKAVFSNKAARFGIYGHYSNRSVAYYALSQLLEIDRVVPASFGVISGLFGIVMPKIEGRPGFSVRDPERRSLSQCLAIQYLDSIAGQVDRSLANFVVERRENQGLGVWAIDNELAFGEAAAMRSITTLTSGVPYPGMNILTGSYNKGLPPLADTALAKKVLSTTDRDIWNTLAPYLTPKEIEYTVLRFHETKDHLRVLQANGLLVENWDKPGLLNSLELSNFYHLPPE